jgi:hypothetical protein
MKKTAFLLLLLLGFSGISSKVLSQSFGFGVDVYRPGKDLAKELDHTPGGVSFQLLMPLMFNGKLSAGADLGVAMYTGEYYDYEYEPGQTVEIFEEDCFYKVHLLLRYKLWNDKLLMPFVEARTGFTTFFSDRYPQEEVGYEGGHSTHGTAFNTGVGGGLMLNFIRLISRNAPEMMYFITSVSFINGNQADYRDMSKVELASSLEEGVYRSKTGMMLFNIGMIFSF